MELVARALDTQDQDQEQMLRKVRERMDRSDSGSQACTCGVSCEHEALSSVAH